MKVEERAVIDEFEGEKEYMKVMSKKDYYICNSISVPLLAG
jgi:hypothetical protein